MKKIIFLLPLFLLLFSACKSDDNATTKGTSVVKATINGVEKTFNTVTAIRSGMHSYETYEVAASINNNPNEMLKFYINVENISDTDEFFRSVKYIKDNMTYEININGNSSNDFDGNAVLIDVSNRTYKGNFNANFKRSNSNQLVKVTKGSFEIYY